MAAQPYIDQWVRLVVRLNHEGSIILLPFNYEWRSAARPTATDLQTFCQSFWTSLGARIMSIMATSYSVLLVEATDRFAVGGAYGSFTPLTNLTGVKSTDALPASVADVISWRTGFAGRSYRGRTYLPGWVDGDANGSTFITAATSLASALATDLLNHHGPVGLEADLSVASIKKLLLTHITGFAIDAFVDSQRKRLIGRGF